MTEKTFRGQSHKWPAYTISCDGESVPSEFRSVRLFQTEAGNFTRLDVKVDDGYGDPGEWSGIAVSYSGQISVSKVSKGETVLALASSGSWSGGSNYSGYVFGKPGAVLWFNRKGSQKWLVFTEEGCVWQDTAPGAVAKEL